MQPTTNGTLFLHRPFSTSAHDYFLSAVSTTASSSCASRFHRNIKLLNLSPCHCTDSSLYVKSYCLRLCGVCVQAHRRRNVARKIVLLKMYKNGWSSKRVSQRKYKMACKNKQFFIQVKYVASVFFTKIYKLKNEVLLKKAKCDKVE